MSADSPMFGGQGTMDPTAMNNNDIDFSSFFDNLTPGMTAPTGNTPGWGMDQYLDYRDFTTNTTGGFPFPQQPQQNNLPFGMAPQATNSFTAMNAAMNPANIMAMQSANGLPAQTANPSTLESSNASSSGYSTRQATGSSQKRPIDSIEPSADSPPKKVRKQRKKRSKEMTEAEANEKRQKFLDRNKVAAHKCRQRKKEWTDNLQTRSQNILFVNETLKLEVNHAYNELSQLKAIIEHAHSLPADRHTCDPERYVRLRQRFDKFCADEKTGFVEGCSRNLAVQKSARSNSLGQGEDMSRRSSQQSHQSQQSQQSSHSVQSSGFGGRSERHDSGVSVNSQANSPGDAAKIGTPKMNNIDEAIDVSNQSLFVGHPQMMPNQRLGPSDLIDPAEYLAALA